MKIVFANKYYFLKGGAERYLFALKELLESHGHQVAPFAIHDPQNIASAGEKYFVSAVDTNARTFSWQGLRTAGRFVYSFEARRKFGELLDASRPDLVHVHNIYHQISPSILPEAKRRGLPVVMTAHDYSLIAPNYALFHDGAVCDQTKPDRFWQAVPHRCVRGSFAASALAAFEKSVQSALKLYVPNIDRIIAPSAFMKNLFVEYGLDASRIVHVPHPIDLSEWGPSSGGNHALFVGRLSEEKGIDVLIRAAAISRDIPVRIVGTGPQEPYLKRLKEELRADNVTFVGFRDGEALRREYAGARFSVVPSIWYEVFGLTVLESYAAGRPVIASRIGGLPEVVRHGETGLLATPRDPHELANAMRELWHDPATADRMGQEGRRWVETDFTPEKHYERIMEVYRSVK